jgi:hypothetical protein
VWSGITGQQLRKKKKRLLLVCGSDSVSLIVIISGWVGTSRSTMNRFCYHSPHPADMALLYSCQEAELNRTNKVGPSSVEN